MLTEMQYVDYLAQRSGNGPHPLCKFLRELRQAAGLSLSQFESRYGISAVVVGAYERGDRTPPVPKLDSIFACYGYQLMAVPVDSSAIRRPVDMATELRAFADQLEAAAARQQEQDASAELLPQAA